jgi:hypothetical protein
MRQFGISYAKTTEPRPALVQGSNLMDFHIFIGKIGLFNSGKSYL